MGPRLTAPLGSRRAFEELRTTGHRGASGLVKVRFAPARDGVPHVAYAIPRRAGGAVARNRIRRRLRAAVDGIAADLRAGNYLVSPDPACRTAPFDELAGALRASLDAAGALEVAQ